MKAYIDIENSKTQNVDTICVDIIKYEYDSEVIFDISSLDKRELSLLYDAIDESKPYKEENIMSWFGGIFNAKESECETLSNEGKDGTYDVYVKSDSSKGHSHDRIDSNGNLLDKYHDCLLSVYMMMEQLELSEQKEKTLNLKIK